MYDLKYFKEITHELIMQNLIHEKNIEIKQLQCQLDEANKVALFYSDVENWQLRTKDETNIDNGCCARIRTSDYIFDETARRFFGGKLARSYINKYGVKE